MPKDFPSDEVYEAYLHPVVDESTELFEWGKPDLHSLRLYPLNFTFTEATFKLISFSKVFFLVRGTKSLMVSPLDCESKGSVNSSPGRVVNLVDDFSYFSLHVC